MKNTGTGDPGEHAYTSNTGKDPKLVCARVMRVADYRGVSMEGLGRLADVSARLLYQIKRGEANPRPNTLRKLADALGCNLQWLIDGSGGMDSVTEPGPTYGTWRTIADLVEALSDQLDVDRSHLWACITSAIERHHTAGKAGKGKP